MASVSRLTITSTENGKKPCLSLLAALPIYLGNLQAATMTRIEDSAI